MHETFDLSGLQELVDGVLDGAVIVDNEAKPLFWNGLLPPIFDTKRRRFARRAEEEKLSAFGILKERTGSEMPWSTMVKEALSSGTAKRFAEMELHLGPDTLKTVWCSLAPIGQLVLITIRDVSGEAHVQDEFRRLLDAERKRGAMLEREVQRRTKDLEAALEQVTALARTDGLTSLLNRRAFQNGVEERLKLAKRQHHDAAFVIADLDFFKSVNDDFGHDAGDKVLIAVAQALLSAVRETDLVARLGGEEFGIFLTDTELDAAPVVAERMRAAVATVKVPGSKNRSMTGSFGVSFYTQKESFTDLYNQADRRLYTAKKEGRNRVVWKDD